MGMMTRRNVKARAVVNTAPVVKPVEEKRESTFTEKIKESGLSKTDINRLSTADLQRFAKELGVKEAEEMSGNQIKKLLISAMED
jgi:hypothetical protein